MEPIPLGTLAVCEVQGVNPLPPDRLFQVVRAATETHGVQILKEVHHAFSPQGDTFAWVISESHIVIHTWPEYRTWTIDVFACGDERRSARLLETILAELTFESCSVRSVPRTAMQHGL